MALDIFIKIGAYKGESMDDKHKGEIDVLAWQWGMSNGGSTHTGGGSGTGKVSVQDLSFTKYLDVSSPDLMLACCNGKHIDKAMMTLRKAGEKPLEYYTITMQDVLITNVSAGGSSSDDRLTENVTLNFGKVKVQYKEQTATGGAGPAPEMGWDIAANKKM